MTLAPDAPMPSLPPASPAQRFSARIGVIVFPGSNCDRDAGTAWEQLGLGEAVYLWHQDSDLQNVEAIILPGGFSYGDALRAGAIARFSPMMNAVLRFAGEGGLVAAICNGFQVACEAGMLPGALMRNENMRFVCRPVGLRVETTDSPFTATYEKGDILTIPIAHGEGRYVCDDATYAQLIAEDRIAFRYVPLPGGAAVSGNSGADANPNGSRDDIAGILGGPYRNILGMMPHPERACRTELGSEDGRPVFEAVHAALARMRS